MEDRISWVWLTWAPAYPCLWQSRVLRIDSCVLNGLPSLEGCGLCTSLGEGSAASGRVMDLQSQARICTCESHDLGYPQHQEASFSLCIERGEIIWGGGITFIERLLCPRHSTNAMLYVYYLVWAVVNDKVGSNTISTWHANCHREVTQAEVGSTKSDSQASIFHHSCPNELLREKSKTQNGDRMGPETC